VLTVSENGYGKRTHCEEFPVYGRGGQGVIGMQTSERNGCLVGAVQVSDGDEIMLISDRGTLVRTRVDEVSVLSRNTQGVRLIKLKAEERLVGLERVQEPADQGGHADDDVDEAVEAPDA
jgi:DNA gyrase subunit A